MKKTYLFGILFLVLVSSSISVSAANCRYYLTCWDKPGTDDYCCKVVTVCDDGVDVWVACTNVEASITPPDNESVWTPPIGHVDHGKEIQIPVEKPIEKLIESLTKFGAGTELAKTIRKTGSQGDYFPMANFKLEIDGVIQAGFKEVSGLESETETIEYQDGDDGTVRRRPGPTKYQNIVLKRGFINDPALLEWYKKVTEGVTEKKSGSVIVLDRAGQEAMRYNFYGAWPVNLQGPALDTKGDTHQVEGLRVVEELELAYERIEIRKVSGENNYFPLTFHFADGDVPALIDVASINVLFDPLGLSKERIARSTPWKHHDIQGLDSPELEFTSGEPYRLEMDLFFDRYEEGKGVREFTDKIEKLALVHQELHRPPTSLATPVCLVTWGLKTYECEIEKAETKFTLSLDNGTPVRAIMNIDFKEFSPAEEQLKGKPRH